MSKANRNSSSDPPSSPQVALVTGGTKGVGQGIAVGLAEAGWTVHISGRNADRGQATVERINAAGGEGHFHICEHTDDGQVQKLIAVVHGGDGRLDLLVNNVWAGPRMNHQHPEKFWQRPLSDWNTLIDVGLRAHYVAMHASAPLMIAQGSGLIVNVSSIGTRAYLHSTLYGMAKAALDKMTHDAGLELREHGVTVVSLWPGLVRTELLLASGVDNIAGVSINDAETPELQGRVVAQVAADPELHQLTGSVIISAEAAEKYGITEPDGGTPVSPRVMFGGGPVFPPLS